jgi:type VI protein secretion system component Hcp
MPLLMKIPGVTSEGTTHEHAGWLDLVGFNWGGTRVARTHAAGSHRGESRVWAPQLTSATARRLADAQSALIWMLMVGRTEVPKVTLHWLRTGEGMPVCYFSAEFSSVRIIRIGEDATGAQPVEVIEFSYRNVTLGVRDIGNALTGAQDIVTYDVPQHIGG